MFVDKINLIVYKEMEFYIKIFVSELWKFIIIRIYIYVLIYYF